MKILRNTLLITILFSVCLTGTPIKVVNQIENTEDQLKVLDFTPTVYNSMKDLARLLAITVYENIEREKLVLYLDEHRVKISAGTSFIVIDDVVYQIPTPAILFENDIYLPSDAFFKILHDTVLPSASYDSNTNLLKLIPIGYNIQGILIEEKVNGTILRIKVQKPFKKKQISTFVRRNSHSVQEKNGKG